MRQTPGFLRRSSLGRVRCRGQGLSLLSTLPLSLLSTLPRSRSLSLECYSVWLYRLVRASLSGVYRLVSAALSLVLKRGQGLCCRGQGLCFECSSYIDFNIGRDFSWEKDQVQKTCANQNLILRPRARPRTRPRFGLREREREREREVLLTINQ